MLAIFLAFLVGVIVGLAAGTIIKTYLDFKEWDNK